jgi:hypothetical protein
MNTNNTNNENKPHPHAEIVHAWADGAKIQVKKDNGEWEYCDFPLWNEKIEYRIKPSNEPWSPKTDEKYFYLDVFHGGFCVVYSIWNSTDTDYALRRNKNIFPTEEEAKAAIPRVVDALRGTTNVSANVDSNVDSNVGSEIDGKPLTDGEIALIRALRKARIKDIPKYAHSVLVYEKEGETQSRVAQLCVAFTTDGLISGIGTEDAIVDALKKIKAEQEANNEPA